MDFFSSLLEETEAADDISNGGILMQSPEIERRLPVWEAMSDLFLDTEITEDRYRYIARRVIESGYGKEEVERILWLKSFQFLNRIYETSSVNGRDSRVNGCARIYASQTRTLKDPLPPVWSMRLPDAGPEFASFCPRNTGRRRGAGWLKAFVRFKIMTAPPKPDPSEPTCPSHTA